MIARCAWLSGSDWPAAGEATGEQLDTRGGAVSSRDREETTGIAVAWSLRCRVPDRVPKCVAASAVLGTEESRNHAGSSDGEGRNRTGDTTIFSRVLYQLSYLAAVAQRW
jgi:hypothetical protein